MDVLFIVLYVIIVGVIMFKIDVENVFICLQ